jgi:hypothetical protein
MPQPNIANPTQVLGKNAVLDVTTSAQAITSNTDASTLLHSESLTVCNTSATAATITVDLYDTVSTTATEICVIPVGANQMLEIIKKDSPKKILPDQQLRLTASANSALKAVHTYLEIT